MRLMNGFISKEKYMRERDSGMLGEYYYIDILRERLKNLQDWLIDFPKKIIRLK